MGIYSNEPEFPIKSLFHFLGDWGPSFLAIHLWNNITEDKLKKSEMVNIPKLGLVPSSYLNEILLNWVSPFTAVSFNLFGWNTAVQEVKIPCLIYTHEDNDL